MADTYTTPVPVRLRDLDQEGHVNNAVYATYLEVGRVGYYRDVIGVSLAEVGTVIARLELEYRAPIDLGDDVHVAVAVPSLGESSIPMEYEVSAGGEVAAIGETVQVAFDREAGEPQPIPAAWRKRIEAFEGL